MLLGTFLLSKAIFCWSRELDLGIYFFLCRIFLRVGKCLPYIVREYQCNFFASNILHSKISVPRLVQSFFFTFADAQELSNLEIRNAQLPSDWLHECSVEMFWNVIELTSMDQARSAINSRTSVEEACRLNSKAQEWYFMCL